MSGNAKNTALWSGADVYVAPSGTAGPATLTGAWPAGWEAAGLLDGAEGFTESRDEDTSENYAWGSILYRTTRSKHKRTFKFVALEDNAVTFDLVNPGSERASVAGVRTSKIKAPTSKRFAIGFETRDGDRIKRRFGEATVTEVGDIKEGEEDPTVYEVTVVMFPDADGVIYTTVETDTEEA